MEMQPPVCQVCSGAHAAPLFIVLLVLLILMVVVITTAITLLIWCKLFSKAGYSWALGLLLLVPIANIVVPFFLAFADWPILKELRTLREQSKTGT
jgi:hypothetical protein